VARIRTWARIECSKNRGRV